MQRKDLLSLCALRGCYACLNDLDLISASHSFVQARDDHCLRGVEGMLLLPKALLDHVKARSWCLNRVR